jgi:ketosteroid isomerase-like protein
MLPGGGLSARIGALLPNLVPGEARVKVLTAFRRRRGILGGAVGAEREELVRELFRRWNEGERVVESAEIHPDAVVYSSMTGNEFRGHEGVRRWMREIDEQFENWDLTIEELRRVPGDRLLALGSVHFRGRASGVEFDQPMGWLIDFDAGRVTALRNIVGHDAAIEAAGPG